MIPWKQPITAIVVALCLVWSTGANAGGKKLLPAVEPGEDGLYHHSWYLESFLDLRDDLAESTKAGKRLVIIWEQRGCPYCREMNVVNLRRPEIVNYLKKNFNVIQLNLWGAREVTDFDGEKLPEAKFARKYGVQFTPTIIFFPETMKDIKGKHVRDREAFRLFGYWKPFHFLNSFVYVKTNGYKTQPNFQRWLSAYATKLREQGIEVKLWE
jgi:thioredoxin-related protein